MMNGRIWVQSEEGAGSTFHFTCGFGLPEADSPTADAGRLQKIIDEKSEGDKIPECASEVDRLADSAVPRSVKGIQRRLRILLAEDNPVNQRLVVALLQKRGHSVILASNGREALSLAETEPVDLILLDVQMPQIDGFEATALIRQKEKRTGGHIPIVALTAHAITGDRERCHEAGMDGYLAKPLRPAELDAAISSFAAPIQ